MVNHNAPTNFDRPISVYLEQLSNKSTESKHRTALLRFFSFVDYRELKTSDDFEVSSSEYLRIYAETCRREDLHHFVANLSRLNYTKSYIQSTLQIVVRFFRFHCFTFEHSFVSATIFRFFGDTVEYQDISREFMESIHRNLPGKTRVLFHVMSVSGLHLNEALQIQTNDITWKHGTATILVRESWYNGPERIVYLTKEAKNVLWSYLNRRENMDPRVFPFNVRTLENDLDCAMRKAHPNTTKKISWRITTLWFLKQFELHGSPEVGKRLAGEKPTNNIPFTGPELFGNYRKVALHLKISTATSKNGGKSKSKNQKKKR